MARRAAQHEVAALLPQPASGGDHQTESGAVHEGHAADIEHDAPAGAAAAVQQRCAQAGSAEEVEVPRDRHDHVRRSGFRGPVGPR